MGNWTFSLFSCSVANSLHKLPVIWTLCPYHDVNMSYPDMSSVWISINKSVRLLAPVHDKSRCVLISYWVIPNPWRLTTSASLSFTTYGCGHRSKLSCVLWYMRPLPPGGPLDTKWPPFCTGHFQIHFPKLWYFHQNLTDNNVIIFSGIGYYSIKVYDMVLLNLLTIKWKYLVEIYCHLAGRWTAATIYDHS